jgi:hypothetical protein
MIKAQAVVAAMVAAWCLAWPAYAQRTTLSGHVGCDRHDNVCWLDLEAPVNFRSGQKIDVYFIGQSLKEIVARFVTADCEVSSTCSIIDQCRKFPVVAGKAEIVLDRDYANVVQLSVHSGVKGLAFHCSVAGGPMLQLSEVDLLSE